jgi:MFS family permease
MAESSFRRTLLFYYAHVITYDFIFGYAIFPAYFQLKGVAPEVIGALLAFWAGCIILFEIPAGLLGDMIDRRRLLVLSPLVKGACFVIWIFADGHVSLYFLGIAFWSLASAMRSGTKEALLYEHVAVHAREAKYTAILGKERAFQDGATLAGAALGGLIASQNLELAFWTSLAPLGICALAACFLTDMRVTPRQDTHVSLTRAPALLRSTWGEYFAKAEVRHVTLYVAICVTFLSTLEDFNQLFLLAIKMPVWSIGPTMAVMGLARLALGYHAGKFEQFAALNWLAPMICAGALLVSGFLAPVFALCALAIAYILVAPLMVLTISRFQKALNGASRATTTSVMSALIEGLSVVYNIAIALLFSHLTVLKTYQVAGAYLFLVAIWEMTRKRPAVPLVNVAQITKKLHRNDVERNNSVS